MSYDTCVETYCELARKAVFVFRSQAIRPICSLDAGTRMESRHTRTLILTLFLNHFHFLMPRYIFRRPSGKLDPLAHSVDHL